MRSLPGNVSGTTGNAPHVLEHPAPQRCIARRLLPKVSRNTIECYLVLHEGLDRLDLELTSLNEDLECVFACGQQIENCGNLPLLVRVAANVAVHALSGEAMCLS